MCANIQNVIRNIVVFHDDNIVNKSHLPAPLNTVLNEQISPLIVQPPRENITIRPLAMIEREAIEHAIKVCVGNIPKAAALLDVSPSTLYRKKQGWDV